MLREPGGDAEAALEHLGRSLGLEPKYREMAAGDSDFDPLEGEESFRNLIGR